MKWKINPITKEIIEWVLCIIIAVVLAFLVKFYLCTPTIVQMVSMKPTLKQDQRLLLDRFSIRVAKSVPKRGDIITFEAPSKEYYKTDEMDIKNPIAKYENELQGAWNQFFYYILENTKRSYIKRVVALPGEHVKIENGKVYINDKELEEPYLVEGMQTSPENEQLFDFIVPKDSVFAMGDNRKESLDCRSFGCIPFSKIESKVLIRFWPLDLFGTVQ